MVWDPLILSVRRVPESRCWKKRSTGISPINHYDPFAHSLEYDKGQDSQDQCYNGQCQADDGYDAQGQLVTVRETLLVVIL